MFFMVLRFLLPFLILLKSNWLFVVVVADECNCLFDCDCEVTLPSDRLLLRVFSVVVLVFPVSSSCRSCRRSMPMPMILQFTRLFGCLVDDADETKWLL